MKGLKITFNPTALRKAKTVLRKAKTVYSFGLSECSRVKKFIFYINGERIQIELPV